MKFSMFVLQLISFDIYILYGFLFLRDLIFVFSGSDKFWILLQIKIVCFYAQNTFCN